MEDSEEILQCSPPRSASHAIWSIIRENYNGYEINKCHDKFVLFDFLKTNNRYLFLISSFRHPVDQAFSYRRFFGSPYETDDNLKLCVKSLDLYYQELRQELKTKKEGTLALFVSDETISAPRKLFRRLNKFINLNTSSEIIKKEHTRQIVSPNTKKVIGSHHVSDSNYSDIDLYLELKKYKYKGYEDMLEYEEELFETD